MRTLLLRYTGKSVVLLISVLAGFLMFVPVSRPEAASDALTKKAEMKTEFTQNYQELMRASKSGRTISALGNDRSPFSGLSFWMGDEELSPVLQLSGIPSCSVDTYHATCTFTIDVNGNTQVSGETFYVWPYVSNSTDFYLWTADYSDNHYETTVPFFVEYIYSEGMPLEPVVFDGDPTEDVTITFDLPFQGNNYVTLYLFAADSGLEGFLGAAVGDADAGPYTVDYTTIPRVSTNDFYEMITYGDLGSVWDNDADVEAISTSEYYAKYVTSTTGVRTFEGLPIDGYSIDQWMLFRADSQEEDKVSYYEGNPVDVDPDGSPSVLISFFDLETTPVYRFWSNNYKHHFYTANEAEKNTVINTLSHDWAYEGPAYSVAPLTGSGTCPLYTTPLYRFWSPVYHGHFYTASESEKNTVVSTLSHDWTLEGPAYCVDVDGYMMYDDVYRFWSDRYKGHFYTANEDEKDSVIENLSNDWTFESTVFYVYANY